MANPLKGATAKKANRFKEAQKLISLQEQFITTASHELKTPLTSLKIYTQIIQKYIKAKDFDKAMLYVKRMEGLNNTLNALITDLLDVSRIQTGKLIIEKSQFDISELVEETALDIQEIARKNKIIVSVSKNQKIRADKNRISQVLINLLTNAVKYSENGGEIKIIAKRVGKMFQIKVSDNGIGIEKKFQRRVFDKLYQVELSKTKKIIGLGMGLYICREIIVAHKGKIWVESKVGHGSTFSFCIPISSKN